MTETTRTVRTFPFGVELRESDAERTDIAATFEGIAVPYGVSTDVGSFRETFGVDSIDPSTVVGIPVTWRHGDPVGVITHAENTPDGLLVRGEVLNTAAGRDAATLLRGRALRGLSVGFDRITDAWNAAHDAVTRVRAGVYEIALTHLPAYATAGVATVREDQPMADTVTDAAPPVVADDTNTREFATRADLDALRDRVAAMPLTTTERPVSDDDYLREAARRLLTRAWTDVKLDGTASDQHTPPASVTASVNMARVTVMAIGVQPLPAEGMDATWMLDDVDPTVGVQATEKTEIPSGPANGILATAPVVTYAGGNDVSLQFLARASAWNYPHLMRRFAEQYGRKTNAAVATSVLAGAAAGITVPATGFNAEVLGDLLGAAAGKIAAGTGRAPAVVVLDPVTFFRFATAAGQGFPIAGGNVGNADLASLSFVAFGLRFYCDPILTAEAVAGAGYVMDPQSVGIQENPGAPLTITANVPSKLGVDTAVYGFMAHKVLNPDGIVKITAAAPALAASSRLPGGVPAECDAPGDPGHVRYPDGRPPITGHERGPPMALVTADQLAKALGKPVPNTDPDVSATAAAADGWLRKYLTPDGADPHDGHEWDKRAALQIAVDMFTGPTAAGGQSVGPDYQPMPYRMGAPLLRSVSGLIAPCRAVGGMIG